ncbi:FeoA family protein [Sorangium sp. So ce124]|uniref:FeoA family protein n=1 Tax=Sorangium sp. So ce124 TaxID=3133280 RepID=UPI003F624659
MVGRLGRNRKKRRRSHPERPAARAAGREALDILAETVHNAIRFEIDFQNLTGPMVSSVPPQFNVSFADVDSAGSVAGTEARARDASAAAPAGPLSEVRAGERVIVVEVGLDAELAAWLGAMGLGPGQTLTSIRRAAFGGPLHVRTGSGGELAINATLARSILVAPLPSQRRVG